MVSSDFLSVNGWAKMSY